jgi:tRNA G10  N-methylase Trm11
LLSIAFELGRKKELCFAELISVLGKDNLLEKDLDTAIFKLKEEQLEGLQDRLGGTIRIIKIIEETTDLEKSIENHLLDTFKGHRGKVPFAISNYNFKNPREIHIKQLLNFCKKTLKKLKINARFVNKDNKNPKPSTIYKAKIIKKGIDIAIIKTKNGYYLGESIDIQDIDSYSKRDYHKPSRDPKIGMLPPKLAQIMINLAGNPKTIYDPFCGTGTVLIEGMFMGKTTIGSDNNSRMIESSNINCNWAKREFPIKGSFKVFEKDARELDVNEKVDAIITEGYLGPPLSSFPNQQKQQELFDELSELHGKWLAKAAKIAPKVVMCVAAFKDNNKIIHLPNFEKIAQEAGYRISQTFTYDRSNQIVARDIKVLEKIA